MAVLIAGMSLLPPMGGANAQNVDLSTDQVTIDLSVLDGLSTAPAASTYIARPAGQAPRQGLQLPGRKNPVSQLHVTTPKAGVRIKLKKPGTRAKRIVKRAVRKAPKVKKAVIKRPKPPTVAAVKPPAPLIKSPPAAMPAAPKSAPKTVAKKKPAPKPAAKTMTKTAPPPPPTMKAVKKPVVAKAPAPAAAAPKAEKKEQAALSPAPKSSSPGRALQVVFAASASKLPAKAKKGLKAVATKLKGKESLRLQLMAYAGGKALSASKARRMSLSRALSIRSYLIENGVRSTRIDVRALGSKTTEKPINRVDVNIVER